MLPYFGMSAKRQPQTLLSFYDINTQSRVRGPNAFMGLYLEAVDSLG